ncbi:MAG: hypothetical protein IKQ31_02045 [Clostridia bacterium]|nr:hypothetical protein [Clostridia bacterium]
MYIGKKQYKRWTIEEKNAIMAEYKEAKKFGRSEKERQVRKMLVEKYNIPCQAVLLRWIKQYKKHGTCVDNRGNCTKKQNLLKGRPKKADIAQKAKDTVTYLKNNANSPLEELRENYLVFPPALIKVKYETKRQAV